MKPPELFARIIERSAASVADIDEMFVSLRSLRKRQKANRPIQYHLTQEVPCPGGIPPKWLIEDDELTYVPLHRHRTFTEADDDRPTDLGDDTYEQTYWNMRHHIHPSDKESVANPNPVQSRLGHRALEGIRGITARLRRTSK